MNLKTISLAFLGSITLLSAKIKVACVGDSITFGSRVKDREQNSYPAQLGKMLGDTYEVKNFGKSGATMLDNGNKPYLKTPEFKASLEFNPDIVIIKLGTNDSKEVNWKHKGNFAASTNKLIAHYQELTSKNGNKPRIILCKPVPVIESGNFGITEKITRKQVAEAIKIVALKQNLELIDLHIPLRDKPEWIPDKVHPNAKGASRIAQHIHRYLTQSREPKTTLNIPWKSSSKSFHGFPLLESNNGKYKIATPRIPAAGNPWIWRARFWSHESQLDIQMLELGYHIAYCDVIDLFGSPKAVKRWNTFYELTQELGLHPKPILEGMSRGGLIIHNWALANPKKVSGIIADNCVMDFKSWPAGFETSAGHPKSWKKCKAAYGFRTDQQAKNYLQNPIDQLDKLKQSNIPLLYIIASDDKIVPPMENSGLAADTLKDHPQLTVIHKPGLGHHPHSLPNPAPITDFALKCYNLQVK